MEARTLAGTLTTLWVAVTAVVADFLLAADLLAIVLLAGLAGGLVTGAWSTAPGHRAAGARAGAAGGAASFLGFVAVGAAQSVLAGTPGTLILGLQTLLVALLVVPLHALGGAVGAAVGLRIRHRLDGAD